MIRGTKKPLEENRPAVNTNLRASIHNRFDIEVVDAKSGAVKQKAKAENVICDQMWSKLFSESRWNGNMHIGTGTGTPSASDTALFSFAKSVSTEIYGRKTNPGVFSVTLKSQLLETDLVGSMLTEVGLAYSSSSSSLCTHAMLTDMNGNQISILKTDTDIIHIYATVFVHYSVTGYNGTLVSGYSQSASVSDGVYKFVYGFLFFLALGQETGSYGSGAGTYHRHYFSSTGTVTAYGSSASDWRGVVWASSISNAFDLENKKIVSTAKRIPAAEGNENKNVYYVMLFSDSGLSYANLIIPSSALFPNGVAVSGDAIGTGDGATTDFTTSFPGISNCTVYVDGVATEVTVDEHTPFLTDVKNDSRLLEYWVKARDGTMHLSQLNLNSPWNLNAGAVCYFRNPHYKHLGISSIKDGGSTGTNCVRYYLSSDLVEWIPLTPDNNGVMAIPEQHRKCEWIKVTAETSASIWAFYNSSSYGFTFDKTSNANVHFAVPPAAGAIITADYTTDVIAKDVNHVFDLTIETTLGEYTED